MTQFGRMVHARAHVAPALVVLAMAVAVVALPASAAAADLHATSPTFASVFASAQGGDTVYLASGAYGSWSGGAKSSMVTVAPEPGATPMMSGGNFGSSVRNITIRGVTFTGPVEVAPGSTPLNLVFDGDTWGNVGHAAHEGRLSIAGGGPVNGVQVKNSTFGPGGCSDGIQDSSRGTEVGPGNEFKGIVQGSCSEHADAIQPYASNDIYIHDNYFHDNEQGIMSPDGVSTGYRIINNVIHTSTGYPCMHMGDTRNGTINHNVCRNGAIRVYGGNQNVASQNMVVQNNAAAIDASACSGCTIDHNQTVTYTGGSGRCAYATASPKATGSDGTDIGLNDCTTTTPPPPPPPADTTPPDTTITSGPSGPTSDSGPTFAFVSAETGSTFACRVDGGSYTACTSPWTTSALSDGAHTVSVRATDAAGNTDTTPPTRSFTVDTAAPRTTITSSPSALSLSGSGSVAFTVSEAGASSRCRVDGGPWAACTSSYQVSGLGNGSHRVDVRSTDAAGNVESPGAGASWTVLAPAAPAGAPAGPIVTLTAPTANATVGPIARFTATVSSSSPIRRVEFWVDSTLVATDAQAPYSARVDLSSVRSGMHTVTARAFNGQAASSATVVRVSHRYRRVQAAAVSSAGRPALLGTAVAGPDATRLAGQAPRRRMLQATLTRCGDRTGRVADRARLRADGRGRLSATRARPGLCVLALSLAS